MIVTEYATFVSVMFAAPPTASLLRSRVSLFKPYTMKYISGVYAVAVTIQLIVACTAPTELLKMMGTFGAAEPTVN